jgi:restriction system protein
MKQAPPGVFERLVVDLLLKMGYGGPSNAGWVVGKPGDEGIDGIINEDKLGLDVIYVQAKRWEGTVGRKTTQEFTGSLEGQKANKGVLITTSQFSAEAYDYVSKIGKKVILIDGIHLAELMIEYKLAVQVVNAYESMRIDKDYFSGESLSAAD